MTISIKRSYDTPQKEDGFRVLIDRLWPRGLSKERAAIDLWAKNIAPSTELRKWFGHDPEKWVEFQRRYLAEIEANPALPELVKSIKGRRVTLVYSAKDERHNDAVVLQKFLSGGT